MLKAKQDEQNEDQAEKKQFIRIKQFKFNQGLTKSRSNSRPDKVTFDDLPSPLKILAHKLSITSEQNSNNPTTTIRQTLINKQEEVNGEQDEFFKKMLTPRDVLFKPKRSIFNRYNYQNYHNYEYKNPFKPKRYPVQDKMQQKLRNNVGQGSQKNLEIIFCEQKYQQFVERTNKNVQQFYSTKKNVPKVVRSKSNPKIQRTKSEQKNLSKTWYNNKKRKTTLSNYLQEFNTLEKLSLFMQRQHKLNQKYLLRSNPDSSRTVLLEIVTHRFEFLKKIKKKHRDLIFKIILGVQALSPLYKINIQQYIKFIQLFISRDAEDVLIAMFIFKFLFHGAKEINLNYALDTLSEVGNTLSRHEAVERRLEFIFKDKLIRPKEVYESIKQDITLHNTFIDLITL